MASTESAGLGKRLLLIDGSALVYRCFYAFIRNPLRNARGELTSISFGILQTLLPLLAARRPDKVAIVFDTAAPTFRHKVYAEYKAHRPPVPADLSAQLPRVREVLDLLGIPIVEQAGVEADDLIGSLAREGERDGAEVLILTGDKDFFQLVTERVTVLATQGRSSDLVLMDAAAVRERYGVEPGQMIDLLALMGDASDNVPGVPGIGEKTASQLIQRFHSLDGLYEAVDRIERASLREKIRGNEASARLSRKLVTIRADLPLDRHWWELARRAVDRRGLSALLDDLEFHTLKRRFASELADEEPAGDLFPETIRPKASSKQGGRSGAGQDAGTTVAVAPAPRVPFGEYRVVDSAEALEGLARELRETKDPVAFDTETTGYHPLRVDLVGISLATAPGRAFYLPVGHTEGRNLDPDRAREALRPFFDDPGARRVAQNGKYDWHVLHRFGVPVRNIAFDTMIAAYLIDPDQPKNLDALSFSRLGLQKITTESLLGTGRDAISMDRVPIDRVAAYSCEDADATLRLMALLERDLDQAGVRPLFEDVEMPLVGVLARMERAGVRVDTPALEAMAASLGKDIQRLEDEIQEAAGVPFNVNSTRQVAEVLFERLKLPRGKRTKDGFSTDVEVLETLQAIHPLPKLLLAHRQAQKLKSGYLDALPRLVNPETGRIHATFHQTVAATGRLSASDPSLQNIPVRTEEGRAIRAAFVAGGERGLLASFDYSQIELRLLAHLSHDPVLTEAFRAGTDIHTATASRLLGVPAESVTPAQRAQAKIVNFGIIYGMGPARLARELSLSRALATAFIAEYKRSLAGVASFLERVLANARNTGYVETILKRRRPLPALRAEGARRAEAERAAVNAPIQGSAADLIKVAMVKIDALLLEQGLRTKLILQVHDELLFETDQDEIETVAPIIHQVMEHAIPIRVPLVVNEGRGRTWAEAHA